MKSAASVAFAALLAVGLAGCGGLGGMFGGGSAAPAGADPTASSAGGGDSLANLLAFHTTNPGPVPAALPDPNKIQGCPDIEVQGGTAALRVGGPSNEAVRYQFSLGDYARSCQVQAKTLAIKVGVRGFALLGPKGSAGAYRAPLRVAIRRESDGKVAFSKVYAVSASIDAATGQAPFELVVPDIALPDLGDPSSDYTILVGFDSGGRFGAAPHKRRKRKGA